MPNLNSAAPVPWARSLRLRRIVFVILFVVIGCAASIVAQSKKRMVAYYFYGDKNEIPKYTAAQIPYKKLTDLIHVAIHPAPSGDGTIQIAPGALEPELIPKAHAAKVRVLVCVQGAASLFSKIAADPAARLRFAASLKEFVIRYHYDGVDIDWEVPQGHADVVNSVALMQAIRDALPSPRYLLSMATPSNPGRWGDYDFTSLTPIVDFYNVMTYDFHEPGTEHTGHNSPLFTDADDPSYEGSIDDSVNNYLNKFGVPPEKLNIGVAFYGYQYPVSKMYSPCRCEKTAISRNYGSYIKQRINKDGWVRHFDPIAMTPYLTHENPPGFITYDGPQSIARKVAYILQIRDLGGVFMWELSADYDGKNQDLLNSMHKAFVRAEAEDKKK